MTPSPSALFALLLPFFRLVLLMVIAQKGALSAYAA